MLRTCAPALTFTHRTCRNGLSTAGQPHQYESTGQLAILDGLTAYPNAKTLRQEAQQCLAGLPPDQAPAEFDVLAVWDPKDGFTGGEVAGVCFVYRTDGAPLR